MITEILRELGPSCRDDRRRRLIVENPVLGLNGIQFVEYRQNAVAPFHVLELHFLLPLPVGAYTLPANLTLIRIYGGTRIVDITPIPSPAPDPLRPNVLIVPVSAQGDFSTYWIALGWSRDATGAWRFALPGVDRQFSVAPIFFRADCPTDFDCLPVEDCPPDQLKEPALDYLARDYASFRQLLLDFLAQRNPTWLERNPSDLGIALIELFAYEGDHLSYLQDSVANEAYLDTARQRVSAKRHAKLIDYAMHDGRNAWTFVHAAVSVDGAVPLGTQLLTRITTPLLGQISAPATVVAPILDSRFESDPALRHVRVFETAMPMRARVLNNEIRIHTWGNAACCLPRGTVTAHLFSVTTVGGVQQAVRPDILPGDYLLLEEVRGPETGAPADADVQHRQVVLVEAIDNMITDPVFHRDLAAGALQLASGPNVLPLLEVTWRRVDALRFPLCLSALTPDGREIRDISVARGNLALADHGRTTTETFHFDPPVRTDARFRLTLAAAPLTMQCQPADLNYDATTAALLTPRTALDCGVRDARPALVLRVTDEAGFSSIWRAMPDLLASNAFHNHFVVDVENDGRATVRPGDGDYGREFAGTRDILARYRVGNGRPGNIGADALAHIVVPPPVGPPWPTITLVRNPIPAVAGEEPESIEQVRQYAPAAFRARQFRAVTEADYRAAALTTDGVSGAVAWFRWTGSWYTVFVGIDPRDPEDLITENGGRTRLSDGLERRVRHTLNRYRMTGYDLEIRAARYIPLEIEIDICVCPRHFRGDVAQAVRNALSSQTDTRGRTGFFSPDRFTFGEPVYLSQIYAAIEAVAGVDSAVVTVFQRFGRNPAGELGTGVLPIGPWEIARLDNDASRPENGVLTINALGGK